MIHRKLFESVKSHLPKKEFSIITGARQTGKSTILRQLGAYCSEKSIPTVFINLENKPILADLIDNPLNLLRFIPASEKRVVVFVDEIQYLSDPSNFLKLLYDEHSERIKIVATGSSAFYIDSRFSDSLAGRKRLFYLPTCSFDEYLEFRELIHLVEEKNQILNNPDYRSPKLPYLKVEWESYMIYGGYPAIILEPNIHEKIERLKELRDSFIKRDILESGVGNQSAFYNLLRILASQTGSLVNKNELSSTLRIKAETVTSYLEIMQKCFHITLVNPFFKNLRKELVKMPKVFLLDTGLRNCLLNNFNPIDQRPDRGELLENTIFNFLSTSFGKDNIQYWRTSSGNEVDFVIPNIPDPRAIEVKFDKNLIKMSKYNNFMETYPGLPLHFTWMKPFDESFFQRINSITEVKI